MTNYRDRKLDRVYEHDERSLRDYPIRKLALDPPMTKSWDVDVWLDQGNDGACVGFGFAHELNAYPDRIPCDTSCAFDIYHTSQRIDDWPGEDYEGTSVLAGAKTLTSDGYYTNYFWAETEEDMARAVSHTGPVVIGIDWYNGMFDPDADGFIHPTGGVAGGHCILVKGIDVEGGYYILHNSWGRSWGDNGTAKLSRTDMDYLLRNWGEVCLPVRASIVDPAPDPIEPTPIDPVGKCGFWCRVWKFIKSLL
jgi:Papain family cysteine protease